MGSSLLVQLLTYSEKELIVRSSFYQKIYATRILATESITMFKAAIRRHALQGIKSCASAPRAATSSSLIQSSNPMIVQSRFISSTPYFHKKKSGKGFDPESASTTASKESAEHEGKYARTDESIQVEYPPDSEMPRTPIVQGRGGRHFKRTLASFSLEDKVSVITGGARGLGLVMAQGLVASGSDVAIVDMNGESLVPANYKLSGLFGD